MGPIRVTVRRGPLAEAVHRVHAVAVRDGRIVESAGNPELVTYYRSSSKPIQALPLARERPDVPDVEVAIACASHRAEPLQLEAARSLLERAPAAETDLELGPQDGRGPSLLSHNCSGKHAGFLAVCRARGWPTEGYRLERHPLQQLLLDEVAALAEVPRDGVPFAIDGCGVLTFGLTLERAATAFGRLPRLDGGERVVRAMRANPDLLRGPVALDVQLIRSLDGWFAKGGAEGLLCAASADGLVLALKVMDGSFRALAPALTHVLGRLGVEGEALGGLEVTNARGERVGELRVVQ